VAVPKNKVSQSRKKMRRANKYLTMGQRGKCPRCETARLAHTVCTSCGFYRGSLYPIVKDEIEE